MQTLPESETALPVQALAGGFRNVTNSYKFYWFLAILEHVSKFHTPKIAIIDLAAEMVVLAWYPINYFNLSFGKQDKLSDAVKSLRTETNTESNSDSERIRAAFKSLDHTSNAHKIVTERTRYVPYRFVRPWFAEETRGLPDQQINTRIQELCKRDFHSQTPPMYRFVDDSIEINTNETYNNSSAIRLAVSDTFRELLERSYASSLWVTIIDPKVTLKFFEKTKDVVLIHFSDQYTNSAGYDAITVTKQTELYREILRHGSDDAVGEFNAFNGEWLLKMVTANEKIRREREGIIGAWKLMSALVAKSAITWVPMSVAEMIRVSGNIGLRMSDSDFARYHKDKTNTGRISDDVLFAGFKDGKLYLLPSGNVD